MKRPGGVASAFLLLLVAALYFSVGRNLSLEWSDEGQIIYPSWRVSGGAIPYRDFRQLYGPSVFFVNGALFRLFGPDLWIIRISLVIVKAAVAAGAYAGARCLVSWPLAVLAYVLCLAVWGTPWWVFNTPYANHYGLLFGFAGLLGFHALRGRFLTACALAGLCFGLAATFKQTSGLFGLVAFVAFLVWGGVAGASGAVAPSAWLDRGSRVVRVGALLGVLAISAVYLSPRSSLRWTFLMLFSPLLMSIGALLRREVEARGDPALRVRSVAGMICAGGGFMLPLAGYAAYYARLGALSALVANTLTELPAKIRWFVPLPLPAFRPAVLTVGVLSALLALRWWQSPPRDRYARGWVAAASALAVLCLVTLLRDVVTQQGLRAYLLMMAWHHDVIPLVYAIPFLTVWASWKVVCVDQWRAGPIDGPPGVAGEPWPVLGLFYFFGLTSLLLLYPAADFWHVVMGLPAWLPLLAFQLERFRCPPDARGRPGRTERRSALLVAILVLALCAPFVDTLRFVQRTQHGEAPLARASGIVGWPPRFTEAVEVIRYLDSLPKEAPLLVIANEQMIYFLAGRSSVITDGEYVLYLVGADAIAGDDARALLPEQRLIERLESTKPLIVDYTGNPMSQRFRNAFPRTATYVETRYRLQQAVGQYRVLAWAGA